MAVTGPISHRAFAAGGRAGRHFVGEMAGTAADLQILFPVWKSQQRSVRKTDGLTQTHPRKAHLTYTHPHTS